MTTEHIQSTATPHVISAAAGSGKTTRLVQAYLEHLKAGIAPERIIAITFTRKAAAELVSRVSQALRVAAHHEAGVPPSFFELFERCYRDCTPTDPRLVERALLSLTAAPVGTTDSFVADLLGEFALDASLASPDGPVPIDVPTISLARRTDIMTRAARAVIDPADGEVPGEARFLLRHFTLAELVEHVAELGMDPSLDEGLPLLSASTVDDLLADELVRAFRHGQKKVSWIGQKDVAASAPYRPALEEWMNRACPDPVPTGAVRWIAARITGSRSYDARTMLEYLGSRKIDLGLIEVDVASIVRHLPSRPPGDKGSPAEIADRVRTRLVSLAQRTRAHGLAMAASTGQLDYDLLTLAAIQLCEDPPERLRRRFDALLVDEAQDSNPLQMRLYRALTALPGDGQTLQTLYVGDQRQSIYLFRGAEPSLFDGLVQSAMSAGTHGELNRNYRSTPRLIEATKALFGELSRASAAGPAMVGVTSCAGIEAPTGSTADELGEEHLPWTDPVVMVVRHKDAPKWSGGDATDAGIDVFCERLKRAWQSEGRQSDTAAVLTTSWARARRALDRVRALLGPDAAFIDGGRGLAQTRSCRDVRMIVSALFVGNEVSWLGLWKHPMVGLTDAAFAPMSAGEGLHHDEAVAPCSLSSAVLADALDPEHYDPIDVDTFARVVGPLRQAQRDIGSLPTAAVVDRLCRDLRWRAIVAAGPEGTDALAALDVTLDWIREFEAQQVDPAGVIDLLEPDRIDDVPRLDVHRGRRTVSVTTVFQAKGLEYDHVLVDAIGHASVLNLTAQWPRAVARWEGSDHCLVGVRVDPSGGIRDSADSVSAVADALVEARRRQELLRLAYVAITRARRSVTFSLSDVGLGGIHKALHDRWINPPEPLPGVMVYRSKGPRRVGLTRSGYSVATGPFVVQPAAQHGAELVAPSQAAEVWHAEHRDKLAEHLASHAKFVAGGPEIAPPQLGASASELGELMHAWLARYQFDRDKLDIGDARDLCQSRGLSSSAAEWLVACSKMLHERCEDLLQELIGGKWQLRFEVPVVGLDESRPQLPRLHVGRVDLIASDGSRARIFDFKAGARSPSTRDGDLRHGANLDEYGPQLVAYARSLTRLGYQVTEIGLLFTQTGDYVSWDWGSVPSVDVAAEEAVPFDRRLLLLSAMKAFESEARIFSLNELAEVALYKASSVKTYYSKKFKDYLIHQVGRGKYRVQGALELDDDEFLQLMDQRSDVVLAQALAGEGQRRPRAVDLLHHALELWHQPWSSAGVHAALALMVEAWSVVAMELDGDTLTEEENAVLAQLSGLLDMPKLLLPELKVVIAPVLERNVIALRARFATMHEGTRTETPLDDLAVGAERIDYRAICVRYGKDVEEAARRLASSLGQV